jgi:NADH-quinone oxidoreductase subunit M
MMLLSLMVLPLAFAVIVAMAKPERAYRVALAGTLVTLLWGVQTLRAFNWNIGGEFQLGTEISWLPTLGLTLSVGADSVAMLLIALTLLLGPICIVASKTAIKENTRTYYAWLLVLQAAMTGVFASRDLILFYICFEFTLVPMYVLISLYGSTNRRKAAIKFFLYTFTGSVIALAGLVYVAFAHAAKHGLWTFDIATLEATARSLPASAQAWVLLALLCGFAVKVPLFPVHTWLPLAHTEAPTAGSVILAGVLLKLGTYAIFRFVLPFTPLAVAEYAPVLGVFCIIGILYGGLICWVQTDVKKLVAYSSVAHLGFCMLGMFALNRTGLQGSLLYMINHGLSTGALFLLIGMIYERYHTRNMKELGGLAAKMPVWATFMVFFVMASVGLPGLNGFVSEFLCLAGAFQASSAWGTQLWGSSGGFTGGQVPGATAGSLGPWYAAVAGVGMIIAAMYLLYMVGKVVWGPLVEPHGHGHGHGHGHAHEAGVSHASDDHLPSDLTRREIGTLIPLAVACLALGVYPKPVMDALDAPIARTVGIVEKARSAPVLTPDRAHAEAKSMMNLDGTSGETSGRTTR